MAESRHELREEQRVLAERARALALPRQVEKDGRESRDVVTFALGAERYGIEIGLVQEVRPLEQGAFCRVPCAPAFVVGIVNIRGRIHCVIDIGAYFGLAPQPLTGSAHVLVVATTGDRAAAAREVAILSDEMPATVSIRGDRLRPPPETVSAGVQGFIHGVTADMLVFLDIGKLLEDPGMIVHDGE